MADTDYYSMTDAMVYCMTQPGVVAVAFVELKTGLAIAGDGINNIDIDALTPCLTKWLTLNYGDAGYGNEELNDKLFSSIDNARNDLPEVAITMKKNIHLMKPLSGNASDLYLYLVMDRDEGTVPLGRRCLAEVASKLYI